MTMLLSAGSTAYADGFRLRMQDLSTGQGIVLSDDDLDGLLSYDSPAFGNFVVMFTIGTSKPAVGGVNNYSELNLTSLDVRKVTASAATLRITIEDTDYSNGPDGSMQFRSSASGTLQNCASCSITVQSWLNSSNDVPAFGADQPTSVVLAPVTPAGSPSIAAWSAGPVTFGPGGGSYAADSAYVPFTKAGPYSIFTQVDMNFTALGGTGQVNVASTVPLPEPTSLLLLGSGLATLGFLGRRRMLNLRRKTR